jgi:hypothetical protein
VALFADVRVLSVSINNRLYEDDGSEEAWMHERKVDEGAGAHGMADSDYGKGHFSAEMVDHV